MSGTPAGLGSVASVPAQDDATSWAVKRRWLPVSLTLLLAVWWVLVTTVACLRIIARWGADDVRADYLAAAMMGHMNSAVFGFPAVLGVPAGGAMPYHPGPLYVGLFSLVERVASGGSGSLPPLVFLFVLSSVAMYGASAWFTWKSVGSWAATALLIGVGIVVAAFPHSVGALFIPGNENLQAPAALLGIASAVALSRGLRSGFVGSAVAFVFLAQVHWGSVPLAVVLLAHAAVSVVRLRPSFASLVVPGLIYSAAAVPWFWLAFAYPRFYEGILSWLGSGRKSMGFGDSAYGVADDIAGVFSPSFGPLVECQELACLPSRSLLPLGVLLTLAALGAVFLYRARLRFVSSLVVGSFAYGAAVVYLNPNAANGSRLFYVLVAIWVFAAAYACSRFAWRLVRSPRAASAALVVAALAFPVCFVPFLKVYLGNDSPWRGPAPMYPSLAGTPVQGSVLLVGDPSLRLQAAALAVGELRRGNLSCIWVRDIPPRPEGNNEGWTQLDSPYLLGSPCPPSGDLLVLNPESPPPSEPIARLSDWGDDLDVYVAGPIECQEVFPCRDLSAELREFFPSQAP